MNVQEHIKRYGEEIIETLFGSIEEGGSGSGNYGHAGRKGMRGGSLPHGISDMLSHLKEGNPRDLIKLRGKLPKVIQGDMTQYTVNDIKKEGVKVFVDKGINFGYGLKGNEIVNLISVKKGMGKVALIHAIREGGKRLDCFDKRGLVQFYEKGGFVEVKREKNWTPGGPDNVYMALRKKRG